jgi:hypothetical protein
MTVNSYRPFPMPCQQIYSRILRTKVPLKKGATVNSNDVGFIHSFIEKCWTSQLVTAGTLLNRNLMKICWSGHSFLVVFPWCYASFEAEDLKICACSLTLECAFWCVASRLEVRVLCCFVQGSGLECYCCFVQGGISAVCKAGDQQCEG